MRTTSSARPRSNADGRRYSSSALPDTRSRTLTTISPSSIYQDRILEAQVRLGELPRWRILAKRKLRFQVRLYRRRLWCGQKWGVA